MANYKSNTNRNTTRNTNRNTTSNQPQMNTAAAAEPEKKWYDVNGRMTVYGRERDDGSVRFSTAIGVKNNDGEWDNGFFDVAFKKDEKPEEIGRFDIVVNSGFLSFRRYKDTIYWRVVVLDWDYAE